MGGYWSLGSWNARKNLLLVASYIFYGAWNPPFALLLMFSTVVDYWVALRMAGADTPRCTRQPGGNYRSPERCYTSPDKGRRRSHRFPLR